MRMPRAAMLLLSLLAACSSGRSGPGGAAPVAWIRPAEPFPLQNVLRAVPQIYAPAVDHIEGPVWRDGNLYFADDDSNGRIMRVDPRGRLLHWFPTLRPIGTFALADGSVLVCEKTHLLVRITRDDRVEDLSDLPSGCNDVTVDAEGNIYHSDFRERVYRLTPGGVADTVLTGLSRPNGIEVDPASRYLYLVMGNQLHRAPLMPGQRPGAPEFVMELPGNGDGCAFDEWGNLWIAIYPIGALAIVNPETRTLLATVSAGAPSRVTNLVFGGPNRDVVYTTVGLSGVWRIPVGVRGFAGHPGARQYPVLRMIAVTPANTPAP